MLKKAARFVCRASLKRRFSNGCTMGRSSVLYKESEIINNLGDKKKIVIGENTHIRGQLLTFGHGGDISIGDYCYVGRNTYIWSGCKIEIGDRVLISHNCSIFDNDTHSLNPQKRHAQFRHIIEKGQPTNIDLNDKEVVIEDDVLIGANAIILKGVKIGKGAVVAAGSIVTKDVESLSVVAGNPARFIKKIS